ncbi:MAG: ABC transporter substrate-binding protein, partial [Pseudomonadota bacterium]
MKIKTSLMSCAAAIAVALSLTAPASAQETIRWLQWWDPEYGEEVMDDLVSRFEAQSGIKVERTAVPWDNMFELLVANARSRTADYDVLGMEAEWLTAIDRLGGLATLDSYLEAGPEFAASLSDATPVRWLGETKMLNWYIFPYSFTYNIEVLEDAGIEPPKSWDDVIPTAQAVAEATGGSINGLGTFYNENGADYLPYYMFGSRLAQLGGKFFDEDGNVAFNSQEGVQAINWWKEIYD